MFKCDCLHLALPLVTSSSAWPTYLNLLDPTFQTRLPFLFFIFSFVSPLPPSKTKTRPLFSSFREKRNATLPLSFSLLFFVFIQPTFISKSLSLPCSHRSSFV
ncbi:MAG: hypothetical protein JOS17DRAFT_403222 [Linnemannia elongata]|nr:MAG: hypothetical protein JOS17DRAFT_403222 [Linnemannia elongata]